LENKRATSEEEKQAARLAYVQSLMRSESDASLAGAQVVAPDRPKSSWEIQKEAEEKEAEKRRKVVKVREERKAEQQAAKVGVHCLNGP
jgi:hypothetical protein